MPLVSERGATSAGRIPDISKRLTEVDDREVKLLKRIPKGPKPKNIKEEWSVDDDIERKLKGESDEKDAGTGYEDVYDGYRMIEMYIHRWMREIKVGTYQQILVENSGIPRGQALAKTIAKMIEAMAKDQEQRMLSDLDAGAGQNKGEYEWRGLHKWAQSTAQSVLPVPEKYRTPAGAIDTTTWANFDEESLIDILQARYERKGMGKDLQGYVGTQLKRKISHWQVYGKDETDMTILRRHNEKPTTLRQKVDIIDSDFGRIILEASSFINVGGIGDETTDASRRSGLFVDLEDLSLNELRGLKFTPLEDQGGGPRGYIDAFNLLRVDDPTGLAAARPS